MAEALDAKTVRLCKIIGLRPISKLTVILEIPIKMLWLKQ
jgi:hypothetical protein